MALPSRDQTFAYANCRELLDKLNREIDRYLEVAGNNQVYESGELVRLVDQLKGSAFNASVTAWHLSDWVFSDLPEKQRKRLGFEKVRDLQGHARENCRALYLCRYAATASKHWVVSNCADPTVKIVVTADGGWNIYFVDNEKKIPADQVFSAARDWWESFIRNNGIPKALDDRDLEMI